MENMNDHQWSVTKDKLIREILSTYEAILKFQDYEMKTGDELESLSMDDLYAELQTQTELLDKLVSNWDIKK